MKKLLTTTAIALATASTGALANSTDYSDASRWNNIDNVRNNLTTVYNNLQANSWGAAGSDRGMNALIGLNNYVRTAHSGFGEGSFTIGYSSSGGFQASGTQATEGEFTEARFDDAVNFLVGEVQIDMFGRGSLDDYLITNQSTGTISVRAESGLAGQHFTGALSVINSNIPSLRALNQSGGAVAYNALLNTTIGHFNNDSSIGLVNDGIEALRGITAVATTVQGNINGARNYGTAAHTSVSTAYADHTTLQNDGSYTMYFCNATDWATNNTAARVTDPSTCPTS